MNKQDANGVFVYIKDKKIVKIMEFVERLGINEKTELYPDFDYFVQVFYKREKEFGGEIVKFIGFKKGDKTYTTYNTMEYLSLLNQDNS